jgi:hypothetical protein
MIARITQTARVAVPVLIASTVKAVQSSSGEKHTATAAAVPRDEPGTAAASTPSATERDEEPHVFT